MNHLIFGLGGNIMLILSNPILRWDKPKKVMTSQQWGEHYGFDGGPIGGYAPNMSEADQLSWKAKITGKRIGFPQVEIRKTTERGSQFVIIVNLGEGYNYKYYRAVNDEYIQYIDYQDYIIKEATKYHIKWPKNYPTMADAINFIKDDGGTDGEARFWQSKYPTKGINVHMSTNGPIQMTFDEMQDMQKAIEEAKIALVSLEIAPSYAAKS